MTLLLNTTDIAKLVAAQGMPVVLGQLAQRIEQDFRRWSEFDKSARVASHSTHGVIELMPIADDRMYSFKYVNGHPKNTAEGMPTVMAFGVLAEVSSGRPLLISELTVTTALRTAATSVVAARALARPQPRSMALIGNGAQSEFQALAFHHLLGVTEIHAYDIDRAASAKLVRNLAGVPGLTVRVFDSTAAAVHGVDIVTTVTADKNYATILTPEMVEPGMHINAVGGDCPGKTELHPDVLRRSSVFVEYEPQSRIEGDVQQMPADFPVTELWRVLDQRAAGRRNPMEVTVFDSVGFALEDYSALNYLWAGAQRRGLGRRVELVAQPANPKDLLGHITPAPAAISSSAAMAIAGRPRRQSAHPWPRSSAP
jgi:ornithine cyclodeaminase